MEKPGRNDPCYCGSGKKYKQCHMTADMAAERQQRAVADASRELRQRLIEFVENEAPFAGELDAAASHYWQDYYTADTRHLMSIAEAERFFDWFLFDATLPSTGGRPVDWFQTEQAAALNEIEADLLAQWAKAGPMSGYELISYEQQHLRLKEVVSGEAVDVFEPAGHGNAPLGSWILGRLVPVQGQSEFFMLPAYIPPEEIADLPEKLAAARAEAGNPEPAVFLRTHNVMFIHHALEQAKLAGRPPVARLDPHHTPEGVPQRQRRAKDRVKGPNTQPGDSQPHMAQTRRKAI